MLFLSFVKKKDSISIFCYNKIGLLLHFKSCCWEAQARQDCHDKERQLILQLPSGLMHFSPFTSLRCMLLDGIQQERKKGRWFELHSHLPPLYHTQTTGTHREGMLESSQMCREGSAVKQLFFCQQKAG